MNEGKKHSLKKNLAQERLERLRPDLKLKRKINEKLDKFSEKSEKGNISHSPPKANVFREKFLSSDTVTLMTTDKKQRPKYSADQRLKKARAQVLKNVYKLESDQATATHSVIEESKKSKYERLPQCPSQKKVIPSSPSSKKLPKSQIRGPKLSYENTKVDLNRNTKPLTDVMPKKLDRMKDIHHPSHCVEQSEQNESTFMDVDMEECYSVSTSIQSRKMTQQEAIDFWSSNDSNDKIIDVNEEIQRFRGDHSYLALHENVAFDIEMKLCVPEGDLLIVADTNIFLGHLNFLMRLVDCKILAYKLHVLVIPWLVIQEIDYASKKCKDSISKAAKIANRFIYDCLKKGHPHVFGQSLEDFKINLKHVGSVDDCILQYCLKFVELKTNVVLLTDDKNLCNKSIVSNVPVYTREEFERVFQIHV